MKTLWLKPTNIESFLSTKGRKRNYIVTSRSLVWVDRIGLTLAEDELTSFVGRTILLAAEQMTTIAALKSLDGWAKRIVIWPPDLQLTHLSQICLEAQVDAILTDRQELFADAQLPPRYFPTWSTAGGPRIASPVTQTASPVTQTEWILFTSGTTGVPKMASHSLATLTGAIAPGSQDTAIWGTFYDIRRYGGLQILLRALIGGASLILGDAGESLSLYLDMLARHGATHVSGTPTHWRNALMRDDINQVKPTDIRLSGEIADQAILDRLRAQFPNSSIGHAFASTEAGVAFEVTDAIEGFPASYLAEPKDKVYLKVVNGTLRVRSPRAARGYLGPRGGRLSDDEGYVDTGDMIDIGTSRCRFLGRAGGIINVGGLKVNPEEIEQVLHRSPKVQLARVFAKKSPVTGAIVVAEVVARPGCDTTGLSSELEAHCRGLLPQYKAPASIKIVSAIDVSENGKIRRNG